MLNRLTYRKKNQLLLAGAGLLLLLVYSFAISKTVALRSTCLKLEQRVDSAAHLPEETAGMEAKLAQIEKNFGSDSASGNTHEALLGVVSAWSQQHHLVLREFPELLQYRNREWNVETHRFTVEGNFTELLRLVHLLEQTQQLGKVVSADYRSRRDPRTKALSLTVTVYVQHLNKDNHEKS